MRLAIIFLSAGLGLTALPAHAVVIGDTVTARAEVEGSSFPIFDDLMAEVIDPGIEFSNGTGSFTIDVLAESFRVAIFASATTIGDLTVDLTDLDWTDEAGRVTGLSLDDIIGADPSQVLSLSFTDDSVTVVFDQFGDGSGEDLDRIFTFGIAAEHGSTPVPLPASLPLLIAGLGGLAALRRFKPGAAAPDR